MGGEIDICQLRTQNVKIEKTETIVAKEVEIRGGYPGSGTFNWQVLYRLAVEDTTLN